MLSATAAGVDAAFFAELRAREFGRIERSGLAYLDYTGSALYGESQLRAHHELLSSSLFGNPHSASAPSRASTEVIERMRERVLRFAGVDASTHDVIFTANTSAAIKLVAESYPFTRDTALVLAADNHNSVNGIREYARRAAARRATIALHDELRLVDAERVLRENASPAGGLLAFPAQSNFSGVRHPLALVAQAHELGYDVLLDVAAYAAAAPLDLSACPADFAALSFYKLFGYPTGVGALIARREALARLRRLWFSGGTVLYASAAADTHRLRPRHEAFEDGTPNFLSIAALEAGFELLEQVQLPRLSAHVAALTAQLLDELRALGHVRIYGPPDVTARGGTIALNVLARDGSVIPFATVEERATSRNIAVRGGCFCNPGASEAAFVLDRDVIETCFDTLQDDFTIERFAACTGTAVGAIRISLGLANDASDVARAVELLASFRGAA